jgi:hypothetical protein
MPLRFALGDDDRIPGTGWRWRGWWGCRRTVNECNRDLTTAIQEQNEVVLVHLETCSAM